MTQFFTISGIFRRKTIGSGGTSTGNNQSGTAGFTLLEVAVVLSIAIVLSGLVLASSRFGSRGLVVRRSAQLVQGVLREAQNNALGAKQVGGTSGDAYGVYFALQQNPIAFVDQDNDKLYDLGEEVSTTLLDESVLVTLFSLPGSSLTIAFVPPTPSVFVNGSAATVDTLITLSNRDDPAVSRVVRVNIIGLVNVE